MSTDTATAALNATDRDLGARDNSPLAIKHNRRSWMTAVLETITSFPGMVAGVLVAAVFRICRNRIVDPDLWWHLRDAQYLVANLRLPRIDTYTHTTPGLQWINHEWLSELLYYGAYRAFDLQGVYILFAAGLATLAVIIFWLCMKEHGDPLVSAVAALSGILLQTVGYGSRTQTFGWLCFAAMFAVMLRFRAARRAPLWLLPPIFCFWINLHGSWVFGGMVYAMFIAAGLAHHDLGRLVADPWSWDELKKGRRHPRLRRRYPLISACPPSGSLRKESRRLFLQLPGSRRYTHPNLLGYLLLGRFAPKQVGETFHIGVEDRSDVEGEQLRNHQPADHGQSQRLPRFGAGAVAQSDR